MDVEYEDVIETQNHKSGKIAGFFKFWAKSGLMVGILGVALVFLYLTVYCVYFLSVPAAAREEPGAANVFFPTPVEALKRAQNFSWPSMPGVALPGLPEFSGLSFSLPSLPDLPSVSFNPLAWFKSVTSDDELNLSALKVKALIVQPEQVRPVISVSGVIDYYEKVDIVSRTAGRIQKILVKEGDRVRKDQELIQIERLPLEIELTKQKAAMHAAYSEYRLSREKLGNARNGVEIRKKNIYKQQTRVKMLKAHMHKSRQTYEGKKILYKQGGISREEVLGLKTDLLSKEAEYLVARKELEIATVGFRDQDIRRKGYKIQKDPKKKFNTQVKVNTGIERAEVNVALSRYLSAKAGMKSTLMLLKETMIRSPIKGIVAAKNRGVGEQVTGGAVTSSGQAILVVVDIDQVFVRLHVREADLVRLKKGQSLDFTVDVYKDKNFKGQVYIINPVINRQTHTVEVRALLDNAEHLLKPGMFARGGIHTGDAVPKIVLPLSAVLPGENKEAWVFTLKKGLVFKQKVQLGDQVGEKIVIESGLKAGELVLTEKFAQLREGLKVQPIMTRVEPEL